MSAGSIETALLVENHERCTPSLDDADVHKIVKSVLRYPIGWTDDKTDLWICRLIGPSAESIYKAIRHSCGAGDRCFQSREGLAELLNCNPSTIQRGIPTLEEARLIEKVSRKAKGIDKANEYRLLEIPRVY